MAITRAFGLSRLRYQPSRLSLSDKHCFARRICIYVKPILDFLIEGLAYYQTLVSIGMIVVGSAGGILYRS